MGLAADWPTGGLHGLVVTPWYPSRGNRMVGSYVATQAQLSARLIGPTAVLHCDEWPGGPPEVTDLLEPAVDELLGLLPEREGWALPDPAGVLLRVPVMMVGGYTVADRAVAAARAAVAALPRERLESLRVVHGHVGYLGGLTAARVAPPQAKVFVTEHSTGLVELLADPAGRELYREALDRAERLFCVSGVLRRQVLEAFPDAADKVEVLWNPIDVAAIPRRPANPSLRNWVYVGGLIERKGVLRLLRAFGAVAAEDPDVRLTVVGDGPLRSAAETLAAELDVADRVAFRGVLGHQETMAELARGDVLVHLSEYETFGLSVVEAVAAGLAVVVTRCGGPEEALAGLDLESVRFVPTGDDVATVVAAYRELADAARRWDITDNRARAEERFGPAAFLTRLATRYGDPGGPATRWRAAGTRPVQTVVVSNTGRRHELLVADIRGARSLRRPVVAVTDAPAVAGAAERRYRAGALAAAGPAIGRCVPKPGAHLLPGNPRAFPVAAEVLRSRPDLGIAVGVPTPRVLMLVGNDAATDTRVRKEALAVAEQGYDVTLLALSRHGLREESFLGPVRIVRVPVTFAAREAREAARADRRRARRVPGLPERADAQLARAQRIGWRYYDAARHRTAFGAAWQRELAEVRDYERCFAPVIDELRPDVIHAHDVHLLGIAVDAARRTGAWCIYDAHEYVSGLSRYGARTKRVVAAWADLERDYVRRADRVITVSPVLARTLRRDFRLSRTPEVVLNVPEQEDCAAEGEMDVRSACGLDAGTPLLVYSGAVQKARGVQTAVAALAELTDHHLAVVCVPGPHTPAARALAAQAAALGVTDRLHLLRPVAPSRVAQFLATADVGLIPLQHFPSHEMALTNKLFEYLHAGLPIVVSDCRSQQEFVTSYGIGTVHRADDPEGLARAVREVEADRAGFRARVAEPQLRERYTWHEQARRLVAVYRDLVGEGGIAPVRVEPVTSGSREESDLRGAAAETDTVVLAIGPANSAGQGWEWGRAVERNVTDAKARVIAVLNGRIDFPADESVTQQAFMRDSGWANRISSEAIRTWTHVLLEAGRPILGLRNGGDFVGDARLLQDVGVEVGLVFHGSEIRDPRAHAARYPWSPFADPANELTARLQRKVDELKPLVEAFEGAKFVSTPDLLDDVPDAQWLPVVVDTGVWKPGPQLLTRTRPVVLHAPSNSALKGSAAVDAVLQELDSRGVVEYRRITTTRPDEMPALVADADIVLDQFALGSYGVMAVQALAMGRLVVGNVVAAVRERLPLPLPVVDSTPAELEQVLAGLLADVERSRSLGAAGVDFVRALHDGRLAADVLDRGFLRPERYP